MGTRICEMFGIEAPIIAFSHCRDVVVEASKAGGMGVLGAESFTPEELAVELAWIEEHIHGRPYGVDVLFPVKFQDISRQKDVDPQTLLPRRQREFVESILQQHSVPHLPDGEEEAIARDRLRRGRATPMYSAQLLDVAFRSPGVKLIVSAIGTPPLEIVQRAHAAGMKFGAMVGKVEHALRQRDAGVDLIIAQGDDITMEDMEVEAFHQIRTPVKRLVVLPETSHMTLYSDLSRLELASRAAASWYTDHLVNINTPERLLTQI